MRIRSTVRGVEQARREFPALLDAAAAGQTIIVTRHGRAIAAIGPVPQAAARTPSLLALAGSGKGMWGRQSAVQIARLRDEWTR